MMFPDQERLGLGNKSYYQKYYSERPPENYTWLLLEIIKYGRPGNILDLGCGLGLFVEIGRMWGLDVRGLDGSEDAIKMALSRNASLNLTHHLLSEPLPLNDCSIDNILLNQVIEHLPDVVMTNILRESNRVLRSGGVIFIYSPSKASKIEVLKDPTHINPLYPSQLQKVLISSGFEIIAEPNSTRIKTQNPVLSRVFRGLMKTSLRDWLSASTNAYAKKKGN